MLDFRERRCLQASMEAEANAAVRQLDELGRNPRPFDNPLSGLGRIDWAQDPSERLKQVLLLPVALLVVLLLALVVPFAYLSHLWSISARKRALRRKMARRPVTEIVSVPEPKNIASLWALWGLSGDEYSSEDQVALLSEWISILYGRDAASTIDLEEKMTLIRERNREANRPYAEGVPGAPRYRFMPVVESLVRDLSKELPDYDRVA